MARTLQKQVSIKLPSDVVAAARVVSSVTEESMGELLGRLLREPLFELEEQALDVREQVHRARRATTPNGNLAKGGTIDG